MSKDFELCVELVTVKFHLHLKEFYSIFCKWKYSAEFFVIYFIVGRVEASHWHLPYRVSSESSNCDWILDKWSTIIASKNVSDDSF